MFLTLKVYLPLNVMGAGTFLPPLSAPGRITLQRLSLDLTSAQILALETTAITLVPAPGVGFQIVPFMCIVHFFGGTVAYTNAGGIVKLTVGATMLQALTEQFITTVSPNRTVTVTGCFGSGAVATSPGQGSSSAANPPDTDNAPLTIEKITNNYAAGNGTARVTIYYTIEPTT
jgi:hypothetical protein